MPADQESIVIDRYWFLTWTTYGTWLPGDDRGYVGKAPDESGLIVNHNQFATPPAPAFPARREAAMRNLKSPPIWLSTDQATVLLQQLQETTVFRNWVLISVAIMCNHLHAIVGVPGDPDPEKILGDLKAYGSRALNKGWGKPACGTWWTTSGSKRKLKDEAAIKHATQYIRQQENPLAIWEQKSV